MNQKKLCGKIIKITKNSVYMDIEKDWKRFPVQISIRKRDIEKAVKFLGDFVYFTITSGGYIKILSESGHRKGKLDTS